MATICLLHGNWHDGSCWEPLARRLELLGHRALTPDLPLHDPTAGFAERARPAIEALVSAEPPVAVVGHSLAAGIAPIVAAGTGATIVIYLCPAPTGPFADVDVEIAPVRRTFSLPPTDEHGASVWDPEVAVETIYARLPRDIARAVADRLRPGSSAPNRYQLGGHPDLPGRLILATEDELFDPEWSRRVASAVLRTEPIEITAGHFPMLEAPAELARLLGGLMHIAGTTRRPDAS
jgi:pimeloyl-ACP methyl ester carboxylesterase